MEIFPEYLGDKESWNSCEGFQLSLFIRILRKYFLLKQCFLKERLLFCFFLYENRNKSLTNWSIDYRLKEKIV